VAGVDLSAASALAVRSAAALFPEASIRATYVLDLPVGTADAAPVQNMSEAEADVDAFLSASDLGAVVATRSALVGEPARSLEIVAAQDGADLVVVGTAGRGGLPRALLGSTAQAILRQAPTDVLTVPRPPGER
jgi:nucleotide-binding universal stress UspA family protein